LAARKGKKSLGTNRESVFATCKRKIRHKGIADCGEIVDASKGGAILQKIGRSLERDKLRTFRAGTVQRSKNGVRVTIQGKRRARLFWNEE